MLARTSIVALFIAVAGVASAQTSLELEHLVNKSNDVAVNINPGGNVYASPFDAKFDDHGNKSNLEVYCVDITDEAIFHQAGHVTLLDAANLGSNWQEAAALYNYYAPTATTEVEKGGLQVAIWTALFGVSSSASGNSTTSQAIIDQATADLAGSFSGASDHATVYRFDNTSEDEDCRTHKNQDMMGGSQAVPEPMSMLALGTGALALLRRRK
jgi:hypothetical protein